MAQMGFDFERGRLDESAHPFCGGVPDDIRITTRYDGADFTKGLMAILHETGHALTSAACREAWRHQPVGEARGMAVHESQSLLIEMQVSRSPAFLGYLAPLLAATFGRYDPALSRRQPVPPLRSTSSAVYPGRRRRGDLSAARDLALRSRARAARRPPPGRRSAGRLERGMQELLGITPPDDRRGCLQDIHWSSGAFGYFPATRWARSSRRSCSRPRERRRARHRGLARARRFLPAARLAASERPRARLPSGHARAAHEGDGPPTRAAAIPRPPTHAVCCLNVSTSITTRFGIEGSERRRYIFTYGDVRLLPRSLELPN